MGIEPLTRKLAIVCTLLPLRPESTWLKRVILAVLISISISPACFVDRDCQRSRALELAAYTALALTRDPSLSFRLAEASLDIQPTLPGKMALWKAYARPLSNSLSDHTDSVFSPAFSPDGTRIVTASSDRTARANLLMAHGLWEF